MRGAIKAGKLGRGDNDRLTPVLTLLIGTIAKGTAQMPHWSSPPLAPYLLFENPWPLAAILGVAGVMLGFYALRYRIKGLWIGAAVAIVLAGSAIGLAASVESTREQVMRLTRDLVHVTLPPLDEPGLSQLLDDQVTLELAGKTARTDRQQVLEQAQRVDRTMQFPAWSIQAVDARATGPGVAQSKLRLSTTIRKGNDPIGALMGESSFPTTWLFEWRYDGQHWRLSRIEWLKIANQSPTPNMLP
jgi:hypothetical protein